VSEHQIDSADKAALHRRVEQGDDGPTMASAPEAHHPLLRLQSVVGNTHIARMIAQRQEGETPEEEGTGAIAQRAEGEAPEDEQEGTGQIQRAAEVGLPGGPVSADTEARIQSQRGAGSSLDASMRDTMEQSFGTSFDSVRVHSDSESHNLNRIVSARAFTTGNDIFLGAQANPSDERMVAHELTHVVQQRSMAGSGAMTVGAAGDPHEQHADQVADAVTARAPAAASPAAAAQREVDPASEVQRAAEGANPEEQEEAASSGAAEIQPEQEEEKT